MTNYVRTTEHMEECRVCGTKTCHDLVDHHFFGFKAGCDLYAADQAKSKRKASALEPGDISMFLAGGRGRYD